MAFLYKYVSVYWKLFTLCLLFLACEAACDLLLPSVMARVVDVGVAQMRMDIVLKLGGLMLLITAAGAVSASGRNILASRVSQNFGADLRSDLYRKIQSLSFANLDKFNRASLITRLTNDVTQTQMFINGLMRVFVKSPLVCIGSLIMAVRLNPHLAVVLAVVVPIVGVLILINIRVGYPFFMKVQQALDRVNGIIREYLSGVRVVKAFNRFDYETDKFEKANAEHQSRSVKALRAMAAFGPGISLTVNLGIVAVIWLGGLGVSGGHMQVGHIIAFINYMTQILFSLMTISMLFNMLVRARASSGRIAEVLAEENRMGGEGDFAQDADVPPGRVDFENVTFRYEGASGAPVLRGISFSCLPGETVGIIGSTGAGKSTLIGLIPRFYDVTSGFVKVGGRDVRELDPRKLREKVAIVPQKTVLFTGTVSENLRWGKEDASPEELERAARMADAHGFVASLPEGYQSRMGQGGVNFSGGQKQRLSIARALVRQPDILILDDCTSALDSVTEAGIKASLKQYARNLTCILIAQRITSVMDADQIVVLDKGQIAGIGSHGELLQSCEIYREIYRSQMGKELNEDASAN